MNVDTKATPELLLEQNIRLAEKLSTQNKVDIVSLQQYYVHEHVGCIP